MDQAERLRNIIKNNDLLSEKKMTARVIAVTSGKGGVGKSSLSINLAIQLGRLGKRVIIFDADFGLANIEIMLGMRPKYNLADLMYRGKKIEDLIAYGPENVGFVSGGSGINELANLSRDQIVMLLQSLCELDNMADVIIVDTGAGISDSVLEFVASSQEVLLVVTPEPTSITDAYALLKTLNRKSVYRNENKTVLKMIANQVRDKNEANELFSKLGIVVGKFLDVKLEYLGEVPYDPNMQKAVMRQTPVSIYAPTCNAAKALETVARTLDNKPVDSKSSRGIVKMFSSVLRMKFFNE